MRYVAAYLLAVLGGNKEPSADDIKDILGSVGIEAEDERLDRVISELSGKDINQVIEAGKEKLATIPTGGVVVAGGGRGGAAPAEEAKEEKKEEKKEESESSDEDMGFGLFD